MTKSNFGRYFTIGMAATGILLSTADNVWAQPPAGGADVIGAGKRGRKTRHRPAQLVTPQLLKRIWTQPITAEQQTSIDAAAKAYNESVAKALGTTVEDLTAKVREARKNGVGKRAQNQAGAAQ